MCGSTGTQTCTRQSPFLEHMCLKYLLSGKHTSSVELNISYFMPLLHASPVKDKPPTHGTCLEDELLVLQEQTCGTCVGQSSALAVGCQCHTAVMGWVWCWCSCFCHKDPTAQSPTLRSGELQCPGPTASISRLFIPWARDWQGHPRAPQLARGLSQPHPFILPIPLLQTGLLHALGQVCGVWQVSAGAPEL